MSLESYCASCTYLGETCNYDGKYYCETKGEPRYASDAKCPNHCEAYGRSNSSRENMYAESESHKSSGCYITTMVCAKLGFDDNCYHLNKLRYLRDKMQNEPTDLPLLLMYDQVGPKIAKCIQDDENGDKLSYYVFKQYIDKAVAAIDDKNERLAKDLYVLMTQTLMNHYGITDTVALETNVNSSELGHGRRRTYPKYTLIAEEK